MKTNPTSNRWGLSIDLCIEHILEYTLCRCSVPFCFVGASRREPLKVESWELAAPAPPPGKVVTEKRERASVASRVNSNILTFQIHKFGL